MNDFDICDLLSLRDLHTVNALVMTLCRSGGACLLDFGPIRVWLSALPKPRKSDTRQRSKTLDISSRHGKPEKVGNNSIRMLPFGNLPAGWVLIIFWTL